jgi:hypothetical protein
MAAWENYHLEFSSDPLSVVSPTYTDITAYARAPSGPPILIQGGTPGTGGVGQYATMTATLEDLDHRFMLGNTSSPLYGLWKPGRRLRCYETIAGRRFDLFTGYVQPPETDDWAEQSADQYVQVTAVDRLGRLLSARNFVSAATEYILYQGGSSLKAYWPLNDASGSTSARQLAATGIADLTIEGVPSSASPNGLLTFSSVQPPAQDDASFVAGGLTLLSDSSAILTADRLVCRSFSPISLASNQYLTLACWLYVTANPVNLAAAATLSHQDTTPLMTIRYNGTTAAWQAYVQVASPVTVDGGPVVVGGWNYVAVRMNTSTGDLDFWTNSNAYTGSAGSGSSSTVDTVVLSPISNGAGWGHAQVYAGDVNAFTFTKFIAQQNASTVRLANQTTGQRINTLGLYAGVAASDLTLIDQGLAVMQRASLAGKAPVTAMREAETTEQGRLRVNGTGAFVFDPRTRRYNA